MTLDNVPVLNDVLERLPYTPQERPELLRRLLGEALDRQLDLCAVPADFKLSVVIPVYNEERWIRELVRRVQAVSIFKEPAWRIYETPISYGGRTYEEGKKIGLKDAFSALFCILRFRYFD